MEDLGQLLEWEKERRLKELVKKAESLQEKMNAADLKLADLEKLEREIDKFFTEIRNLR